MIKSMANNKQDQFPIQLNLNVRGLSQSATLAINEKCSLLKNHGRQVYKLGLGQSPFPVPRPLIDELKVNAFQKDYLPVKGLPSLREAVAEYHCKRHGVCHTAESVLIGPGSKELMFMLQYVYYGDLLIPTPSWVSYAPQAKLIGRNVIWLQTKKENFWRLTAEELEAHCQDDPTRPRLVILNYPSNPVGVTYTIEELKRIAHVARKYKLVLLSDEIYGELHYKGKHISICRYYPEGTILSGGLSKWCGAGGWRLGTFIFPYSLKWLLESMAVMASETFTATSAPIQYAAVRAFQGGDTIEKYLWNARMILEKLGNYLTKKLKQENVFVPKPAGGFYLFPDFSFHQEKLADKGITSSIKMCNQLLDDAGVAILPGASFGRPLDELTARLSFVDFDGAKAMEAVSHLNGKDELDEEFLETHCAPTIKAVDLICEWIRSF